MKGKTSLEAREIFGLSRDDMRCLEKNNVLKPQKFGRGKAAIYSIDDIFRLLSVKMYLLSGSKISEMSMLISAEYDFEEGIEEQIYIYERRILLLNFIKKMKGYIIQLDKIKNQRLCEVNKKIKRGLHLEVYDWDAYLDVSMDFLKIIFILDYLCSKESLRDNKINLNKKITDALNIIKKYPRIKLEDFFCVIFEVYDLSVNEDEFVDSFIELICEIKKDMCIDEVIDNEEILIDLKDDESNLILNEMNRTYIEFLYEYFFSEKVLINFFANLYHFVNNLTKEELENTINRKIKCKMT